MAPCSVVTVTGAETAGLASSSTSRSTSSAVVAGWVSTSGITTGRPLSQPSRIALAESSARRSQPGFG